MRGNSFGKLLSVTSFGESHGIALGAVIDGVPSNLEFSLEDLQNFLNKRKPTKSWMTSRNEPDVVEVVSGIFEGKTLGSPICVMIRNKTQNSAEYDSLKNEFRPGHADKTTMLKYGIRDYRGGGRSSGRETIARVIGGYFAKLVMPELSLETTVLQIGEIDLKDDKLGIDSDELSKYLTGIKKNGESVGGRLSLTIKNCPVGIGEPVFDKLKADLAKAFLSIGGCVSFEYGEGAQFSGLKGSEIIKDISNFGGIEGGISNGEKIYIELVFKAPSTVGKSAKEGRHDPCIVPRAIVVVESMALLTIVDHYLRQKVYLERS